MLRWGGVHYWGVLLGLFFGKSWWKLEDGGNGAVRGFLERAGGGGDCFGSFRDPVFVFLGEKGMRIREVEGNLV